MRLSVLKPQTQERLTRSFQYTHRDDDSVSFKVTTHYLSPALFEKKNDEEQVKVVSRGRVKERTPDLKAWRLGVAKDLLVPAIQKVEGIKVRHLRAMVALDPNEVAKIGKLDDEIPMRRDVLSPDLKAKVDSNAMTGTDADAANKDQAEANMLWLLTNSNDFFEFILEVTSTLSYYQDEAWESAVANLSAGQSTNSAA